MRVFVFFFFALLFLLIVSISALGTGSFTAENNVAVSKDAWPHSFTRTYWCKRWAMEHDGRAYC